MKKIVFICSILLICYNSSFAQTASDVLENGIPLEKGQKIFLKFDSNQKKLKFDVARSLQDKTNPVDFTLLKDSTIFLVSKNGVNVYLRPLNPLNHMFYTENKVVIDPINEAAATALGSIISVLEPVRPAPIKPAGKTPPGSPKVPAQTVCREFTSLVSRLDSLKEGLKNDQKTQIVEIFKKLKALDFEGESATILALTSIKTDKEKIETHFNSLEKTINSIKREIDIYKCEYPEAFTSKHVLNSTLADYTKIKEEQKKRLDNLIVAYNLVKSSQEKASTGGGLEGLQWCIELNEVPSTEGKISRYTISIKESGYRLSDDKQEIVSTESKDIISNQIRIRKFQKFIPEVSIGTAYTFFEYKTYGTTTNSEGVLVVAKPTDNHIRNLNFTTMINYNYYSPNSLVHPLWQIGVGVNSEIPTLLTGIGLRSNIGGESLSIRRIAITGGAALTWVKELDQLEENSPVSGTSDIDKDLKYQLSPIKPYVGIQYNF